MNIDYNAVIEILKSFLENEKTEMLGISVGEERQVRDAIKTLLTAYEKEKEKNKRLEKFIENGEHTWKQKYNETFEYFKQKLKEKEAENKRLRKCHLQHEEMTGIDLLLPEKEE